MISPSSVTHEARVVKKLLHSSDFETHYMAVHDIRSELHMKALTQGRKDQLKEDMFVLGPISILVGDFMDHGWGFLDLGWGFLDLGRRCRFKTFGNQNF